MRVSQLFRTFSEVESPETLNLWAHTWLRGLRSVLSRSETSLKARHRAFKPSEHCPQHLHPPLNRHLPAPIPPIPPSQPPAASGLEFATCSAISTCPATRSAVSTALRRPLSLWQRQSACCSSPRALCQRLQRPQATAATVKSCASAPETTCCTHACQSLRSRKLFATLGGHLTSRWKGQGAPCAARCRPLHPSGPDAPALAASGCCTRWRKCCNSCSDLKLTRDGH